MKKTTRTARKVLSVFLAVLMMLTTWAVAVPGLVLAADGNKYYVKVYVNIYDGSDGYGGAYEVDAATGKPANYSWATSDGWYGRINMTGFTVFGEGGDYDAQDVSAALLEAENLGTYYAMDGLSSDNANGDWDSKAIATAEYTFTLDSFPVEIFWINDENNWDGGNTGFAIRKLTVATSEGGTEHTMWEGLAGSDSETYNYYGSITPTGIHTCFEDGGSENISEYAFYKAITTSSQRAWSDPYSAGTYGTYYVNDYQSGGVSATFSEGVESIAYNVDYINTGSTDTYYMNFINHSKTQSATIVGVNNSDKFVSNPAGTVLAPGEKKSFALTNISSLGGDGGLANFCFNYTLDNVYASDALDASLAVFYQPCYIGTWNASDDSKSASEFHMRYDANLNRGVQMYNTFQTTEGILEEVSTSNSGTNNTTVQFVYNYWINTAGMSTWEETGLRIYGNKTSYMRVNFQPYGYPTECGNMILGGDIANTDAASLTLTDIAFSSISEEMKYNHTQASGYSTYAHYGTAGTPMWADVQAQSLATYYDQPSTGWLRFAGTLFEGSTTSTNPGTITFNNMCYRNSYGNKGYFSGTINVYAFDKEALSNYVRETLLDFAPMKERYDATAFSAYETALMNAMKVLANQKTTQVAVNEAYANLKSAVEALQTTDNLINQIDTLSHVQYVDDVGSAEAASIAERYVLIPLGEHTVTQNTAYIGNGTYKDLTNKNSSLTTNYTKDDTAIDVLNYYYWNIDYSEVDGAIADVQTAIDTVKDDTNYSDEYKQALEDAKAELEAIDQTTTGDSTPSSQEEIDNVINEAKELVSHVSDSHDNCVYDGDDEDTNDDIFESKTNTCTEGGYYKRTCIVCGKVQTVTETGPSGHDCDYSTTPVNDEAEGKHYWVCAVCGENEYFDHTWSAGEVTETPSCGEAGVMTYTCTACGATKTEAIEAEEHSFAITDLGDGTHISKCSKCGANEADAVAEAHSYSYVDNNDGTHTATCNVCGATETANHTFTNPVLTRPTLVDGEWKDGYYTYTCACGAINEVAAERADYSELENAVAELEELNNNENLTDDAKAEIAEALEKAEALADDLVTAEQDKIDTLVDELKDVKADVEKAIEEAKNTSPITEATSGIGVQFLKKTGVDTVESVQLASAGGFEAVRMRLSNNNEDLPITVTKVTADKAYIGADETATSAVYDTATEVAVNGLTDLYIVAPEDFKDAGNITYTINYMVGSDADGYLMDADGNPIVFTTKAYLYVKAEAYQPYHLMDERAAWPLTATSKWQHYVEATNYGDFGLVSNTSASKFNDNLESGTTWISLGYAHTTYDYEEDSCQAGCTDGNYTTGDGHAATYRYYVDTSLAPTWEAAGFRVRVTETAESVYENAPLKYMRVANDQAFLEGISGDDKTFTVTFVPSSTSNVPDKRWSVTSTGTLEVGAMSNSNEDEYLFGEHKNKDGFDETSAYANFTGTIPAGVTDAKFMFSPRIEFNGTSSAESVTMTSHIWLTSYDKAALREAVANAEAAGYNPGYFDADKYAAYEEALANAKEVLGKAETTQTEVDEATAALNTAIADLTASESEAKFVLTVTHSIHENADKNSEATGTDYDYYLVNGDVTPALNNDAIALDTINKYDDVVTLNVTADAAHTYNYWFIDYSGVQGAIDAADAIIDDTTTGYSDEYKAQVEEAKNDLQDILDGKDTTTAPESQSTVDDAIDAVTALTGHTCDEAVEIPAQTPTCEEDGLTAGAKCSVCGKITKAQEVDPATDHNYDIANATLVARPELVDGQWTTGKYEATCLNDESHKLPLEGVQRADYTAFDEAVAKLKELATYENFTDEVKATILNYATELENGTYDPDGDGTPNVPLNYVADYTYDGVTIPGEQATLNSIIAELEGLVAEIEGNKTNESFIKPDFTEAIAKWEEYLALVEQYGGEVAYGTEGDSTTATVVSDGYIKDATNTEVTNGFGYLLENAYNSDSATAADWNATIAEMTATLTAINAGIVDGTLRDPNYEAYDAAVKVYNEETSTVNVSADDVAEVQAAMAIVDAIKANPDATAADSETTIAEQTAIIESINNKYAPCVAGNHDYADATCTEAKTCKTCGATEGEANGHSWSTDFVAQSLPEYDEETATWSQGSYTYICEECGETVEIKADRADYSEYDALVKAYEDIANDETVWSSLTDETIDALTAVKIKLDEIAQDYTKATTDAETGITTPDGQKELEALLEGLDVEIERIKASIEDGSGRRLDFSEFEEAVSEYEGDPDDGIDATIDIASSEDNEKIANLINETRELANIEPIPSAASDEQKQIDAATEEIRAIIEKYADCLANGHAWGEWAENVVVTDGYFETATYSRTCEKCGKVESYEVERENYDAYDEAVDEAEELLNNEELTDAAKEAIQNAIDEANKLDQNLPADIVITDDEGNEEVIDVNENAEAIADATDELNGVIDSLYDENGELKDEYKKIDYSKYDSAVGAYENLKDTMTAEDKAAVEAIKAEIEAIPEDGTAAQYQPQVDKAAEDIAAINAKYGDCANGNHTWGEPVLTKEPTEATPGEYTETCGICGATQITEVGLADYSEFNTVVKELEDLLGTENLTDEAKQTIEDALAEADALDKNLPADVTTLGGQDVKGGQDEIDDLVTKLEKVVADTNADIADGLALKPDYDAWDEAETAYDALDKTDVKDEIIAEADALKAEIAEKRDDDTLTQATATQKDIDDATARLNEIVAGINDGSLKDPDYSAVEEKLEEAKGNDDLNKDTQDKIADIEKALEEIKTKTEPEANAKDNQDDVDALEKELDEILESIENGTATAPDYTEWDKAESTYSALDKTNAPADLVTEAANLKATIDALKADDTANATEDQPTIDNATARLNEIIAEINGILTEKPDFSGYDGSHDVYEKLVEQYGDKIKDGVADDVAALDTIVEGVRDDETATKVDDQSTVDDAKTQLDAIIAGIEDGSLIKDADFTNVKEDLETAKDLVEKNDVIDGVEDRITNIENAIDALENDPTTNATKQDVIDALEDQLEAIIEGIEDGSLIKPDLTEAEKDLADAKDKAENNDVIDGVKEEIANLEKELENIENDGTATKADDQDDVDAIEKALEDIIAGIEDGSLVKPNYDDAENAIENAENYGDELSDEEKKALEELKEALDEIKNNPDTNKKDNQDDVDAIEDAAQAIVDKHTECDKGNHAWGTGVLTRPTEAGAWADGYYTYTCTVCGETKEEPVARADYEAYDKAVADLNALLADETLTDEAKAEIREVLNDNVIADDYITTEQDIVDMAADALKIVLDKIANDETGTYEKPDYTEVDKDLADAKDKAENNDVIDGVKEDIKDIEDKLNEIKNDPTSNKKDDQDDVDALEKELEDIIAGIEDGSLIKPDYTDADKAIEDAEKDIDGGKLSDEDQKALDDLKDKLDDIKNDPTSNKKDDQGDIDAIKDAAQAIVDKYAECAKGNHSYTVKTVNPTCTEKGYDVHTCTLCGKSYKDNYVDSLGHTEQILPAKDPTCSSVGYTEGKKCIVCGEILVAQEEISTLPHTDEDNDGTCDVCGKSGLYDGCTCLCHNNHWFWRLVYLIFRLIWRVFKIHQICPCGAVHY